MPISGIKLSVGIGPGVTRASSITSGSFSLTFDRDVLWTTTADGTIAVHPNGASVTAYTPAETTLETKLVNRFAKNPEPYTATQGVDARPTTTYSAGLVQSLPAAMSAGDSLLLENAAATLASTPRRGLQSAWAGFQFTNALPAQGRTAGPIAWWVAKGATPTTYSIDYDALVSTLPSLSMSGVTAPAVADVITRFDHYFGLAMLTPQDATGEGYEVHVPQGVMNDLVPSAQVSNYGQYLAIVVNAAGLHLIGNAASAAQKRTLLIRMVQIGANLVEGRRATGGAGSLTNGNGGHHQWEFLPIIFYLWARGLTADLDSLRTFLPTNVLAQSFQWTAGQVAQLAPHDNTANISISRRRTITAVSGTTITYSTVNGVDPARFDTRDLIMTRESDGRTATITAVTDTLTTSGSQVVTINAQPSPVFAVNDVIYFQSPYTITAGDYDWRVGNADRQINPSPKQDYRDLNFWLAQVLVPHALGIWRADWNAAKGYVLRTLANEPVGWPFPPHFAARSSWNGTQFDKSAWDAWAAGVGANAL
jgi:hypothetical protein